MGITGLIPFMEKASSSINIRKLEGSSVAVDSYCWLHKGVFACAEKLIRGEKTDIHIQYCMKYIDMLLRHKMNIVMVFDGRHLPAKAETERRRREARNESKKLAKEFLRRNEIEKARSHMRRAVDVTHEMALELIKLCRDRGVDCIVAPYEADAQMAWLNKQGLAEYIVTEDSDLTLFGAQKILFKLDLNGHALLVESTKLYFAMGCKPEKYTFDKFLRMCILSGCDYLDSLHGIGLKKACKFILTTEEDDMTKALKKIPSYLKMKQLEVTDQYIESFLKAEATFKHMFVYNPLKRRMERLNELEKFQTNVKYCSNAGALLDDAEQAFQLALGNLNPFTLKQLDDWHPDRNWAQVKTKCKSIWKNVISSDVIHETSINEQKAKQTMDSTLHFKTIKYKNMDEIECQEKITEERCKLEEYEVFSMYKYASPKIEYKCKRKRTTSSSNEDEESEKYSIAGGNSKKYLHNPFAKVDSFFENIKKSPVCTNNSLLKVLSPKKADEHNLNQQKSSVKSRFFALKKPFAARDLTSEMFKIEEKSRTYIQQQKDLYHYSLQSPIKKTELIGEQAFDEQKPNIIVQYNEDSGTFTNSQENKQCEPAALNEEVILLSDVEEQSSLQKSSNETISVNKFTNKFEQKTKKGILKTKTQTTMRNSAKQSKLSMFGFQKKPMLKKL